MTDARSDAVLTVLSEPASQPPRAWIWSVAWAIESSTFVTWMEIEPVLMIWSSGSAAPKVETGPPLPGLAPSWPAGAAVAAAVGMA